MSEETVVQPHNGCYLVMKGAGLLMHTAAWKDLKCIMLN
jgi:hypothetical protein